MYGIGYGITAIGATTKRSGGIAYDVNALNYFTRNSTLTDVTQKIAINQFYIDLKSYGLFGSSLRAFWFDFLGNSTKCSYNGANPSEQTTYTSGWTFSSSGSKPNGTNAYCDTGIKPSDLSQNAIGIGIYIRENITETSFDIGASNSNYVAISSLLSGSFYGGINQNSFLTSANSDSKGFYSVTRTTSSLIKSFKNGILKVTDTTTSTTPEAINIFKGGLNRGGGILYPSTRQFAFSYIDNGLTETQVANLNTCVTSLMTTLGINV